MKYIKMLLNWILSLFDSSNTPDMDRRIKNKRRLLKEIDEELKKKYTDVDEAMEEWEDE